MNIVPNRLSRQLEDYVAGLTEEKRMAEDIDDSDGLTVDGRHAYNNLKNVIALLAVASRIDPDTLDLIHEYGFQHVERQFVNTQLAIAMLKEDS